MHKDGVTLSPYSIKDTFAIAKLSEPKAGVEITTPQGTDLDRSLGGKPLFLA